MARDLHDYKLLASPTTLSTATTASIASPVPTGGYSSITYQASLPSHTSGTLVLTCYSRVIIDGPWSVLAMATLGAGSSSVHRTISNPGREVQFTRTTTGGGGVDMSYQLGTLMRNFS